MCFNLKVFPRFFIQKYFSLPKILVQTTMLINYWNSALRVVFSLSEWSSLPMYQLGLLFFWLEKQSFDHFTFFFNNFSTTLIFNNFGMCWWFQSYFSTFIFQQLFINFIFPQLSFSLFLRFWFNSLIIFLVLFTFSFLLGWWSSWQSSFWTINEVHFLFLFLF
jgi:hypothetical protein